jgi:hypothetical protein
MQKCPLNLDRVYIRTMFVDTRVLQFRDTQFVNECSNPFLSYLCNKTGSQPADYSGLGQQMYDVPSRMCEV